MFALAFTLFLAAATALQKRSNLAACPLLGQQYPAPTNLADEPKVQAAGKILNEKLDQLVKNDSEYKGYSFSIGLFGTSDDGLIYEYQHTSPGVKNSSLGTNKINADSIYRLGSNSKLLTMYMLLINEGDRLFNHPITDYVPELREYAAHSWNTLTPNWEEITVGNLAGQIAGISRDFGLGDLITELPALPASVRKAFPKVPKNEIPSCAYEEANASVAICTEDQWLQGVASMSPIFPTAYTPAYSNDAFAVLGIALAKITGMPLEKIMSKSLIEPLGLENTWSTIPAKVTKNSVIPGGSVKQGGWDTDFGPFSAAGGYFSTLNDMVKIGKAMLSFQQLSKPLTNRWLKPTSFVESFAEGVGRPWEIFRLKVHGHSVDFYTKTGNWQAYHSFFGLVPDYNIGFTILTASDPTITHGGVLQHGIPNFLADTILPVIDDLAKEQAVCHFAGHYSSSHGNSSITISTDPQYPGLVVTQWTSNGVDLLALEDSLEPHLIWRIVPNQLFSGNKVGFTSFYERARPRPGPGVWYSDCGGWFDVDQTPYASIPLGQMVFDVDGNGNATSVDLRGLRETLVKRLNTAEGTSR